MSTSPAPRESWAVGVDTELQRVAQARSDALQARTNADGSFTHPTMFRVPSFIKDLKPEAYEHRFLSFGLFSRDFEMLTRMDEMRLDVVSRYFEQMKAVSDSRVHSWEDLCVLAAGPVESAQQLRHLYQDGPGENVITSTSVRSVLTLDAVFLTAYLIFHNEEADEVQLPEFEKIFMYSGRKVYNLYFSEVYYDLWLLENQIPLSLIRNLWNQLYEADPSDPRFDSLIRGCIVDAVKSYLHPEAELDDDRISFTNCGDLLHCLYVAFCYHDAPASELLAREATGLTSSSGTTSSASSTTSPEDRDHMPESAPIDQQSRRSSARLTFLGTLSLAIGTLLKYRPRWVRRIIRFFRRKRQNPWLTDDSHYQRYRTLPPVTELHKAGIVVRGKKGSISDIKLVKSTFFKATLYLPQIVLDDNTEKILRNLAMFELIHSEKEDRLLSYLAVMDDLINTEEDVRLLRKGKVPVISGNNLGDDKDAAGLFNALLVNVAFQQSKECGRLTIDVNNWCMHRRKQIFIRFVDRFLDRPWIVVSLVAATLLLVMTALQTTYTVKG